MTHDELKAIIASKMDDENSTSEDVLKCIEDCLNQHLKNLKPFLMKPAIGIIGAFIESSPIVNRIEDGGQ